MENDEHAELLTEIEVTRAVIWRKIIIRMSALLLALAFIVLAFSGVLHLLRLPSLGFLLESRELSRLPEIAAYKEAVVAIRADNRRGTGFNLDPHGLIITNYHILETAETAEIKWQGGRSEIADLLVSQPQSDLAMLAAEGEDLPFLRLETENLPDPGDEVYMIGNPLGFFQVVNRAEYLGLAFIAGREMPVIRIRGPVYQGNSGSPVINLDGKVIGIVFARSATAEDDGDNTTGYAITAAEIADIYSSANFQTGNSG